MGQDIQVAASSRLTLIMGSPELEPIQTACQSRMFSDRCFRKYCPALSIVAHLAGYCPTKQKAPSLISGQGTGLGSGFGPQSGCMQEAADQCFSLTWMFLSLSFSLPAPFPKKKKI